MGFQRQTEKNWQKKKNNTSPLGLKKKEQIFTTFGQHFWEVFLLCNTSIPEHL